MGFDRDAYREQAEVNTANEWPTKYLGDAVYASFDGYHIWLRTGDGNNQQIALEPEVYCALQEYAKNTWGDK